MGEWVLSFYVYSLVLSCLAKGRYEKGIVILLLGKSEKRRGWWLYLCLEITWTLDWSFRRMNGCLLTSHLEIASRQLRASTRRSRQDRGNWLNRLCWWL